MFTIDVMSRVPVYEQLIKQVEDQVLKGIMKEGDKMPSVRSLSMELSTNPNTIQKAYMELDRRGILVSVPGKGSFISAEALKIVGNQSKEKLSDLKEIVRKLAYAGVSKSEITDMIEEDVYKRQHLHCFCHLEYPSIHSSQYHMLLMCTEVK